MPEVMLDEQRAAERRLWERDCGFHDGWGGKPIEQGASKEYQAGYKAGKNERKRYES